MIKQILSIPLLVLIQFYRVAISPVLGRNCRFHPTCSAYAMESIKRHGPFLGTWLTAKRLVKCHPFYEGGIDDPPL